MNTRICLISFLLAMGMYAQTPANMNIDMKLNAGIITSKMKETRAFYTDVLGFSIVFENDFYLLLETPGGEAQLSFLEPDHPSQQPIFQKPFRGEGVYLTLEVANVDALYKILRNQGVEIAISLRDEPWGDRHFAVVDPNGVGIDFVTYSSPQQE